VCRFCFISENPFQAFSLAEILSLSVDQLKGGRSPGTETHGSIPESLAVSFIFSYVFRERHQTTEIDETL
jgi:hypothetical protein